MHGAAFIKMHGLGNDFVVLDARAHAARARRGGGARHRRPAHAASAATSSSLIEPPRDARAAAFMRIRNADGGEVEACGNAARCVAACSCDETGATRVTHRDRGRALLEAERRSDGASRSIWASRGSTGATSRWRASATRCMCPSPRARSRDPVCTQHGQSARDLLRRRCRSDRPRDARARARARSAVPRARQYRRRANAGARTGIRLRVWERGAGITPACGTGACAALVAARRRGLDRRAGPRSCSTAARSTSSGASDGHVLMTGPVAVELSRHARSRARER